MVSVASKLGCSAETLRKWGRWVEGEAGVQAGPKSEEGERLKALERENRELRRANEILRKAAAFFRLDGARPPRDVMVSSIDAHRKAYGVEPICQELPIAPSTYYESKACEAGRAPVSARTRRDAELREEIERVWEENFGVYGVCKVWYALNRRALGSPMHGGRLMGVMGLRGVVRGRRSKTISAAKELPRPADRVGRGV